VLVAVSESGVAHYPHNPEFPDRAISGQHRQVMLRHARIPFDAASLPGQHILPTLGLRGDQAANRLVFNAGGSGMEIETGGSFQWDVDGRHDLLLQFPDRNARVIAIRAEGPNVLDVVAVVDLATGERLVREQFMVRRTFPTPFLTEEAVPSTFYAHSGRAAGSYIRVELKADHSAPSTVIQESGGESPSILYAWSILAGDSLVLRACEDGDGQGGVVNRLIVGREPNPGECDNFYRRRYWTVYTSNFDQYFLNEINADWYSDPSAGQQPAAQFWRAILYRRH
jgi:hypothetical protein